MYFQQKKTFQFAVSLLLMSNALAFEKGTRDQMATHEQSSELLRLAFHDTVITDESNKPGALRGAPVTSGGDYEVIVLEGDQTFEGDEDYEDFEASAAISGNAIEREMQLKSNCYDGVGNAWGIYDSGPDGVDNWYRIIIRYTPKGLYETVPDPDLACSTGDIRIRKRQKGYLEYVERSWEIDYVGECTHYTPARATLTQDGDSNTWTYRWYNSLRTKHIQHEAPVVFRKLKRCKMF